MMRKDIKRWTARRKSELVLEIIQERRRRLRPVISQFDLTPAEIES